MVDALILIISITFILEKMLLKHSTTYCSDLVDDNTYDQKTCNHYRECFITYRNIQKIWNDPNQSSRTITQTPENSKGDTVRSFLQQRLHQIT